MRPSSPRSSRISSTVARYSRSSSRVRPSTGTSSGCSTTSTRRRPVESVWAAPAMPRATPSKCAPRAPPGRRTFWATRAIVPTRAYSPSWRGTSSTRSSSPGSTGRVTSIVGKTTVSSRGMRRSVDAMVNLCQVQTLRALMIPTNLSGADADLERGPAGLASARAPVVRAPVPAVVDTPIASRNEHGLLRSAVVASGATIAVLGVVLVMLAVTFAAERDANRQVDRTQRILRVELAAPDADDQAVAGRLRAEVAAYIRDYARPLAGLAATSPDQARSTTNIAEGRRRVDAIRADFDRLTAGERRHLAARSAGADRAARRAVVVGVGGLLVLLVLVGAFGWYVARRIARPVRDISIAAGRVAAGDLAVRVPEGGPGDLDRLSHAFNAMAASLAEAQDALHRRADELEASGRRTAALLEPVFEQAPAGLAVFDEQMRFVRVNAALARMDGVAQDEHLGRTIGDVLPGAARVWRASYFPVLADAGPAVGSGAIFVDVTDQRRTERERRRLLVAERLAAAHTARLQEITSRLSR